MLDLITRMDQLAGTTPTRTAVRRARLRVDQLVRHHELDDAEVPWPIWLHAHAEDGRLLASLRILEPTQAVVAIAKLRTRFERVALRTEPAPRRAVARELEPLVAA